MVRVGGQRVQGRDGGSIPIGNKVEEMGSGLGDVVENFGKKVESWVGGDAHRSGCPPGKRGSILSGGEVGIELAAR